MKVIDRNTDKIEEVIERTSNSFLVTRHKTSDAGIDCTNWFDEQGFNKTFIVISGDSWCSDPSHKTLIAAEDCPRCQDCGQKVSL